MDSGSLEDMEQGIPIRGVLPSDYEALVALEQEWPVSQRAAPGQLKARMEKFPEGILVAAAEYATRSLHGHLLDPLLEKYRQIGFAVPGPEFVKAGYYPDEASLDYAAVVVKRL